MGSCVLCASGPADMLVRVRFRPGDAFALPAEVPVCGGCRALVASGSPDALAARLSEDFAAVGRLAVARHVIDRAGDPVPLLEPASTIEGRLRGFSPLAEHTGVGAELGPLWPEGHRLSRVDLGEEDAGPDDLWLVRSPWDGLTLGEVLKALWRWVERDPFPCSDADREQRVREFFAWDEEGVRGRLEGPAQA